MPARIYIEAKLAEHDERLRHLEQMLLVRTQPDSQRPARPPAGDPIDVQQRQNETVRRLEAVVL